MHNIGVGGDFFDYGDGLFGIVYIPPEYTSYSSDDAYREIQNEYLMFSPRNSSDIKHSNC
jgi:hypothetical protein